MNSRIRTKEQIKRQTELQRYKRLKEKEIKHGIEMPKEWKKREVEGEFLHRPKGPPRSQKYIGLNPTEHNRIKKRDWAARNPEFAIKNREASKRKRVSHPTYGLRDAISKFRSGKLSIDELVGLCNKAVVRANEGSGGSDQNGGESV